MISTLTRGLGFDPLAWIRDTRRMRKLVFTDAQAKKKLEAILHPMIRGRVRAEIERLEHSAELMYVVIVVPLLVKPAPITTLRTVCWWSIATKRSR